MINIGANELKIMLGDSEIPAIYCGDVQIYPNSITGLSVSPDNLTFSYGGGSLTITIKSEFSWTATAPAFITLSSSSGNSGITTITATAGENTTASELTGSIVVTASEYSSTVSVTQNYQVVPAGYTELQYIYNQSGIAYIPTDIYFTSDMWFEYKFRFITHSSLPERHIFSGSLFDNSQIQVNGTTWFIRGDRTVSERLQVASCYTGNTDHTVVLYKGNNSIIVNGVNKGTLAAKASVDTYKAYFFSFNEQVPANTTSAAYGAIGYLYYYKVGSNTTGDEIYNFVPVKRDSDNAIGLYETVNGVFYGPGNSNKFVAGPEV